MTINKTRVNILFLKNSSYFDHLTENNRNSSVRFNFRNLEVEKKVFITL